LTKIDRIIELIPCEEGNVYLRIVEDVLKIADQKFFTSPCSSSGDHHPPEDNEVGGLYKHTIKAILMGRSLCRAFDISKDRETAILSALAIHDVCKNGYPVWGDKTIQGHGYLVGNLMVEAELFDKYNKECKDVLSLISSHMGRWDSPFTVNHFLLNNDKLIVHLADYIVSRKMVSIEVKEY